MQFIDFVHSHFGTKSYIYIYVWVLASSIIIASNHKSIQAYILKMPAIITQMPEEK